MLHILCYQLMCLKYGNSERILAELGSMSRDQFTIHHIDCTGSSVGMASDLQSRDCVFDPRSAFLPEQSGR